MITTERALVQRIHAKEIQKVMVLKGKPRVTESTIECLKDKVDKHGQEVKMLQTNYQCPRHN